MPGEHRTQQIVGRERRGRAAKSKRAKRKVKEIAPPRQLNRYDHFAG
jgi:hypothetical protein